MESCEVGSFQEESGPGVLPVVLGSAETPAEDWGAVLWDWPCPVC